MDSAEEKTVLLIERCDGILKIECDCHRKLALEDFMGHFLVCQSVTLERRQEVLSVWSSVAGDSSFREFLQESRPEH